MDLVKREWLESVRLILVSKLEIMLYVVVPKNGVQLMTFYQSYILEKKGFL